MAEDKKEAQAADTNVPDFVAEAESAVAQGAEDFTVGSSQKKMEEITVKFGKGCVGNTFTGKDGKEYTSILIPNSDPNDHRPWATFVTRANAVHEDKFGKGMWVKLPAEGHTTIRRDHIVGQDEAGKNIWEPEMTKISNKELKSMVEFYKERPRESVKQKMEEKKAEVQASKDAAEKAPKKTKSKSKDAAL